MRIRVQLAHMPGMLRDVLAEMIERESDMEVVEAHAAMGDVLDSVRSNRAAVVIAGFAPGESIPAAAAIHAQAPRVRLLAIEGREHDAWLYRLQPTRTHLGRISPAQLMLAVRQALEPMHFIRLDREAGPEARKDECPDFVVDLAPPDDLE